MKNILLLLALLASTAVRGEVLDPVWEKAMKTPEGRAYLICARQTWSQNAPKTMPWTSDQLDALSYKVERVCDRQWEALSAARGEKFANQVTVTFERDYIDHFWDGVRR